MKRFEAGIIIIIKNGDKYRLLNCIFILLYFSPVRSSIISSGNKGVTMVLEHVAAFSLFYLSCHLIYAKIHNIRVIIE